MSINLRGKHFWEECARLILIKFAGNEFNDLKNGDRPDLYNSSWGIEVTQVLEPKDGYINALCDRVMGKPYMDVLEKDRRKLEELGICVREFDGKIASFRAPAQWVSDNKVITSFENKLICLNSGNYEYHPRYGLFVFTSMERFNEDEVIQLTRKVNQLQVNSPKRFSKLFISCFFNRFWHCDLDTQANEYIDLTKHWRTLFDTTIIPQAEEYCRNKG